MAAKEIEAYFVKRVKALGGYSYNFRSVTQRGVADRIACLPNGQTWFVELKKPGERLSPLQEVFAEQMETARQHYAVLWSKEGVDSWAERIK